jgi:hypothetical protein
MSDDDLTIIGQRIGYSDTPAEIFGVPVHRNETRLCTYAAIGMAAICLART